MFLTSKSNVMKTMQNTGSVSILKEVENYKDYAGALIVILSRDGSVSFVNDASCAFLGYPKEKIIGANWFGSVLPQAAKAVSMNDFQEFLKKNRTLPDPLANPPLTQRGAGNCSFIHREDEDTMIKEILASALGIMGEDRSNVHPTLIEKKERKRFLLATVKAQEQERHRIAGELHDNVGQLLATTKLILGVEVSRRESALLRSALKNLQSAIDEIRTLSHELNPGTPKGPDLVFLIKQLLKSVAVSGKYKVVLEVKGKKFINQLNNNLSICSYRIIQEQLSNIIKHAKAGEIKMVLIGSENTFTVGIEDDGVGFQVDGPSKGFGLKNIYMRAELFHGCVSLISSPGQGCSLHVRFPVHNKNP